MKTRIKVALLLSFNTLGTYAQSNIPEPVDMMHSNGKIYVVVAVVVTILLGLFLYVFNLDRKISKMEKNSHSIT